MSRLWKSIGAGALGGLAAAFAMDRYQAALSKLGIPNQDQDATVKAAKAISRMAFCHELTDEEESWAVPAVHYSLGIGLGAIYGFLAEKLPAATAGMGTAYGAAIWLGADEIAVPAVGWATGPAETSLVAHVNALASHLVYGAVTGAVVKLMRSAT